MTVQQEKKQVSSKTNLVTAQEQVVLEQIAKGEAPHSQRATAILAVNEGASQRLVAEKAGLTLGQVRYWATKFRSQRLNIFPEDLLGEPKKETEVVMKEKVSIKAKDIKPKKKKKGKKGSKKAEKKTKKEKKKKKKKKGKSKKDKKSK